MQTLPLIRALAVLTLAAGVASSAHAVSISFSGNLRLNTDVAESSFTLRSGLSFIRIYTDSFQNGSNFDPNITLWRRNGTDYDYFDKNDDNPVIGTGQSGYDAGLRYGLLDAGDYLVTVTASSNYPRGVLLSQGFGFDALSGITPTLISQWVAPSANPNVPGSQQGTAWSLQVVADDAVGSVPEPSTYALLAFGLAAVGAAARQKRVR
jgi:hypothetical protein